MPAFVAYRDMVRAGFWRPVGITTPTDSLSASILMGVTIPPLGDPFGGAELLTVELEPHEAAAGVDKPVATLAGGRAIVVRVPAGVEHDTVLHLFGPETDDPTIVKDIHVRVVITSAGAASPDPAPEPPTEVDRAGVDPADADPTAVAPAERESAGARATGEQDATTTAPSGRTRTPVSGNEQTIVLPQPGTAADAPPDADDAMAADPAMFWSLSDPPKPPRTGGTSRLLIVGATAAIVLAGGAAVTVWRGLHGSEAGADVSATLGPPASAAPSTKPLTASEYQALLSEVDTAMTAPMQEVVAARNETALRKATSALVSAAQAGYAKLSGVAPPKGAEAAHQNFVRAFGQFGAVAQDTATAADAGQVCAGSAAVPKITNSPAATSLRTAVHDLAAVDPASPLKAGTWLPAPAGEQTRRLANGTYLKKGNRTGSGQLTIDNTSGTTDSLMSLVFTGGKSVAFTVYVRAGASFTVTGVKDGIYDVYQSSGTDWDTAAPGFSRDCTFAKFEDPLKFTTSNGEYTIWTITLEPAVSGNARTKDVNPDDFPQ